MGVFDNEADYNPVSIDTATQPSSASERFVSSLENEQVRTNAWSSKETLIEDALADMVDMAQGEGAYEASGFQLNPGEAGEESAYREWAEVFANLKSSNPEKFGHLPNSVEEMKVFVDNRIREEVAGNQMYLDAAPDDAFAAETLGGIASAATDEVGVASIVGGLAVGPSLSFGRAVLAETAISVAGETATLPSQFDSAQRLGEDDPNVALQYAVSAGLSVAPLAIGKGIQLSFGNVSPAPRPEQIETGLDYVAQTGAEQSVDRAIISGDLSRAEDTTDANIEGLRAGPKKSGGLVGLIDKHEGGADYDTLFGFSNNGGPFDGVRVSNLTIGQALEFSSVKGAYGQWVKGKVGRVATPMGRYQIVGTTLRATAKEMGLPLNTPFNQETQDAMFRHLAQKRLSRAKTQSQKRAGLRAEWEGFKQASDAELDAAISAFEGGSPIPPPSASPRRAGGRTYTSVTHAAADGVDLPDADIDTVSDLVTQVKNDIFASDQADIPNLPRLFKPKTPEPRTLQQFVRKSGGIFRGDDAGEIAALEANGLLRNTKFSRSTAGNNGGGRALDEIREMAEEAGYCPPVQVLMI